jgi:serine/threonine-protein kinase
VVKVLDFGLVQEIGSSPDQRLTLGNVVVGTPSFVAPERLTDPGASDPRSDLYSVGAVAFFLLSGRQVLDGGQSTLAARRALGTPAPRLRDLPLPTVPHELDALVASCLERSPDARPTSAANLAERLEALVPVVGRWTQDDASAWWRRYEQALPQAQELEPTPVQPAAGARTSSSTGKPSRRVSSTAAS